MATREVKDLLSRASETEYGVAKLAADGDTTAGEVVQGSDARLLAAASLATHLADTSDAHDASAISFAPAAGIAATDVQAAIAEDAGDLAAHLADTSAAHAASAIAFTPAGTIAATTVQAAIEEAAAEASGYTDPMTTRGDLIYRNSSNTTARFPKASAGQGLSWDADDVVARDLYSAVTFVIDGGGAAITTGVKGDIVVPDDCTIVSATALADQSGSIVVDVWKDTYANYPPTDADSITASAPVTIGAATKSQDATLTGWTVNLSAGDVLRFNADSVTDIQRVTIALRCKRR